MEGITSKTNPLIKRYVRLRDSKKARCEEGCFVLETAKLLQEAVGAEVPIETLLVTEQAADQQADLLERLAQKGTRFFCISAAIEEKLTKTANAGGLFAIAAMPSPPSLWETMQQGGRLLYLCQLQDSGNVGTILRTALALGLSGIILSADCCDRYSLKVLRASMGAAFKLPLWISQDPVADLTRLQERFTAYAAVVDADAESVTSCLFAEDRIVVIGNEGNGLPPAVVQCCRQRITIPMDGAAESLNASMAAGILMWELMKR